LPTFDYRYLIPVIPFFAMAAGLSFALARAWTSTRHPRPMPK
jgi:hypothetical protein